MYDRDVPEIPLTIERYEEHLVLSEHPRPHERTGIEHQAWLRRMSEVAAEVVGVPEANAVLKPLAHAR